MKAFLKILGVIIALMIVLVIAGVIALHFLLSPSYIKKTISNQFYQQTGRRLVIRNFDFSIFPTFSIQIDNASIENARGFGSKPFATLNHMNTGLKMLPLLHDKIVTTGFTMNGLTLNLSKAKNGHTNWENLLQSHPALKQQKTPNQQPKPSASAAQKTSKKSAPQSNEQTKPSASYLFNVPQIKIQNMTVNYADASTGQTYRVSNLNFEATHLQNNKNFPFTANVDFTQQTPYKRVVFKATGKMFAAPQQQLFKLLNVDTSLKMTQQSGLKQFHLSNLNATIKLLPKAIRIKSIHAELYQGKLNGSVLVETSNKSLAMTAQGQLTGLQAQPLLDDLYNSNKFSGVGNIKFDLKTQGKEQPQFIKNLKGSGNFSFKKAQFHGFDLGYIYRNAANLIREGKPLSETHSQVTKFGQAQGNYTIHKGLINLKRLLLLSPVLRITGHGSADLNNQKLNLRMQATGMRGSSGDLKENGPTIPFDITGSFQHQKIKPDMSGLLQGQLKKQVDKNLKQLPVNDSIKKKIKDLNLGGFLGN